MALITADRVLETSTTTGAGAKTLAGAVAGYRTFGSVCANGDTAYYYIAAVNASGVPTGDWETGLGTWATGGVFTNTIVHASSNAGAAVNFAAGTKYVSLSLTATQALSNSIGVFDSAPNFLLQARNPNTTTLSVIGASAGSGSDAFSPNGTATARTVSFTNILTESSRIGYVSTAAINSIAGFSGSNVSYAFGARPTVLEFSFGVTDALTGTRMFFGVGASNALASGSNNPNASFLGSRFGVGLRTSDSNLQIFHNDSGDQGATAIDLGASFPGNTNGVDAYRFKIEYFPSGPRRYVYTITNIISGASATGVVTSNIPSATQTMNFSAVRNTGANATACSVDIIGVAAGKFV